MVVSSLDIFSIDETVNIYMVLRYIVYLKKLDGQKSSPIDYFQIEGSRESLSQWLSGTMKIMGCTQAQPRWSKHVDHMTSVCALTK